MKAIKAVAGWVSPSPPSSRTASFASAMSSDAGSSITSVLIPARPENEEPDPEHLPPHHCEQDKKRPQRKVFRNPWPS